MKMSGPCSVTLAMSCGVGLLQGPVTLDQRPSTISLNDIGAASLS
jgi:hypothetical protein